MDSLYNLLSGKNFDEPPEVQAIKQFIRDNFKEDASVTVRDRDIVVVISSAALAGRLRFDMQKLKDHAKTTKRIILRIQQQR